MPGTRGRGGRAAGFAVAWVLMLGAGLAALGALGAPVTQRRSERPAVSGTGFAYDPVLLEHETGASHPERPERLTAVIERLQSKDLLARLVRIGPREDAEAWLGLIHSPEYVARVRRECRAGAPFVDSPDTPVCPRTYEAAVAAVGCVLSAVDAVMEGRVENAFCAVRPPGHHARRERAMGFCIFNNVGIAARYLQKRHGLRKVLIVDWDVHHGNGTQEAFYGDPSVLYFGVHGHPLYPGTGAEEERGSGPGEGFTINVPLRAGAGDEEYVEVVQGSLLRAALDFGPEFVLVSAGFDAHKDDPLGGMEVTAEGFGRLTRLVRGVAERCCDGRLVSVLEGGYSLEGLAESVEAHVRVLME